MAYTFEHSSLAAKPDLDLFSNNPTQASLDEGVHVEYLPTTGITDGSPIKYDISGDSDHYIDLNSSYHYMEAKITKADGSALDEGEEVGPINNLGHSAFQQLDIHLDNTLITDSSNLYHYRALIETLLSSSDESKSSQLSMSLFYKDTAGEMDSFTTGNNGLVTRRELMKKSNTVQLIGKLHSDIFFQNKYLLNGVDIKIKLLRNSDKFVLMAKEDATYKLKITYASLFIRKVKVNDGIQMKHIEKLERQLKPAHYPVSRVTMKSFNIATGSLSCIEENLFNGILPKRIVLFFVKSSSLEGKYNENPFNMLHMFLRYCVLYVDGKMVPQKPLVSDFANGQYLRNYFSLFESTGKAFKDAGIGIDRIEYANGYSMLAFDLTPDLDESGCFHVLKKGNIRFEAKFDKALEEPVNVVVYAEHDATIKIDKNRAVLPNFYS